MLSVPAKEKDAFVSVVVAGGFSLIVVSGAVVSGVGAGSWISHEWVAGEASTLLAASVARTSKVCGPTARPVYVFAEVQGANEPRSSLHSNVRLAGAVPSSLPVKANVASVFVVVAFG
jgi:hypothetical protein